MNNKVAAFTVSEKPSNMFDHLLIYTLKVYIANNMEQYGTKSDCSLKLPKGRHTKHPRFATKAMKSQIWAAVQAVDLCKSPSYISFFYFKDIYGIYFTS